MVVFVCVRLEFKYFDMLCSKGFFDGYELLYATDNRDDAYLKVKQRHIIKRENLYSNTFTVTVL